ncbi:hypothetical protein ACIGEZ_28430 [Streptomyces sp. NPDC085481]|uniref:hypothetical protein n=1 Tax=Streptomyces sp. NPDC085481 TaxID=3365727 RepID=UPI0037D39A33
MTEDRREIARLCENLTWLRGAAEEAGLGERLAAAISAAAAGRAEGVTDLLRRMDVPEAPAVRSPGGIVHPATTEERYGVEVYGCPGAACDRSWIRPPGVAVPRCAVRGSLLAQRDT